MCQQWCPARTRLGPHVVGQQGSVAASLVMAPAKAPSPPCEEAPLVVWPVWWCMWYCPSAWVSCRLAPPVMGVTGDL